MKLQYVKHDDHIKLSVQTYMAGYDSFMEKWPFHFI